MHQNCKGMVSGIMATLPFTLFPSQIIISLVQLAIMWFNAIPNQSGISWHWSPRELIYGHQLDVTKHSWVPFGLYYEVPKEHQPSNFISPWTQLAITLGPTGNIEGSYNFLSHHQEEDYSSILQWIGHAWLHYWPSKSNLMRGTWYQGSGFFRIDKKIFSKTKKWSSFQLGQPYQNCSLPCHQCKAAWGGSCEP